MNVAAIFSGRFTEDEVEEAESPEHPRAPPPKRLRPEAHQVVVLTASGTMEEEEIEEDEADLSSYVEELEEDATFEEMEEKNSLG